MSRTLEQKTNYAGFPKAAELIEMTGTHALEASDRAILNTLLQHAHDSGRLTDPEAEWEIPLADLRVSKHGSNDRLRDSLKRLRSVTVNVVYEAPDKGDGKGPEERVILSGLIDSFDVSVDELAVRATLRFGLPKKLPSLLAKSGRWGRIKSEIVYAMTSKYAIALYELIQLRANLHRSFEAFEMDRFRELMGVPPGAYERGLDFRKKVIEPALLEVNGLSDVGVEIELRRRHARAPISEVAVTWWRKEGDEFRASIQELGKSKLGRMARLRGQVEAIRPVGETLAEAPSAVE